MTINKPILIVVNDQQVGGFGRYTGEILKAEGFNAFQIETLDTIMPNQLNGCDIVILAETRLSPAQAALFRAFVLGGGRLVAFCPDRQLHDLFGIAGVSELIEEGYLKIDTSIPPGKGLAAETLQFHGAAQGYHIKGATALAALYKDAATPTSYPALVSHFYGQGRAVAFAYNLPASLALTRQGNPAFAGQERDGILGIRASDMFVGWVDSSRNSLNQADEQMHLLAHLLEDLGADRRPLPRLWYFPGSLKCLVLLTDDGEDSPEEDFESHFADIESYGAHMTLYLKGAYIPPETVARWIARGHEIGAHFDDTAEAAHPTITGMQAVADAMLKAHQDAYGLTLRTVRNHWIVWVGWSEQAEIELARGIRLDCNYYHYDQNSTFGHWLGGPGSFTGSSLPMKFAAPDGRVLDIYQAVTQLPDEHWRAADFFPAFKTLLDRSLDQEGYAFLTLNCHTNQWPWSREPVMAMLAYAQEREVPVWTAAHALDFLTARDAASFEDVRWSGQELTFTLAAPDFSQDLTILLPEQINGLRFYAVQREGVEQPYAARTIKGRAYIMTAAGGGPAGTVHFCARYQA